jgi:hypothetical protein
MIQLLRLIYGALIGLFRSSARREAEILVLRHQNNIDRLLFVLLSWLLPTTLDALTVIRPDTLIRWHRAGFRAYWCWKCPSSRRSMDAEETSIVRLYRYSEQ